MYAINRGIFRRILTCIRSNDVSYWNGLAAKQLNSKEYKYAHFNGHFTHESRPNFQTNFNYTIWNIGRFLFNTIVLDV